MVSLAYGIGAYAYGRFVDQALADALDLHTLRHGTDPLTYVKIHREGASPSNDTSQLRRLSHHYEEDRFALCDSTDTYGPLAHYVYDYFEGIGNLLPEVIDKVVCFTQSIFQSEFMQDFRNPSSPLYSFLLNNTPLMLATQKVIQYQLTFVQKLVSSLTLLKYYDTAATTRKTAVLVLAGVMAFLTPTIQFRFDEAHYKSLHQAGMLPVLRITKNPISPLNIGLIGTLKNGIRELPSKLSDCSTKMIWGAGKLAFAGGALYAGTALFPGFLTAHKTALIAGALLAAF